MTEALAGATAVKAAPDRLDVSRSQAVRRFKWMILLPLVLMLFSLLTPVLLLQLYFSFHQWTVYLSSWWNADFVGLDIFATSSPIPVSAGRYCARSPSPAARRSAASCSDFSWRT